MNFNEQLLLASFKMQWNFFLIYKTKKLSFLKLTKTESDIKYSKEKKMTRNNNNNKKGIKREIDICIWNLKKNWAKLARKNNQNQKKTHST